MEMTFSYFFAYSYDGVSLICSISCIDLLITSLVFVLKSPDFHISLQRYIYKKKGTYVQSAWPKLEISKDGERDLHCLLM